MIFFLSINNNKQIDMIDSLIYKLLKCILLILLFITIATIGLRNVDDLGLDDFDRSGWNGGISEGSTRDIFGNILDENGNYDIWGNLGDMNVYHDWDWDL